MFSCCSSRYLLLTYLLVVVSLSLIAPFVSPFTVLKYDVNFSKEDVLNGLSPMEYRLIFGDVRYPNFDIVYPKWDHIRTELNDKELSKESKQLEMNASNIKFDVLLQPSNQFLSPHMSVTSPNEELSAQLDKVPNVSAEWHRSNEDVHQECHWRFVNSTYIITVDECHSKGIHALVITKRSLGVLYPVINDGKNMESNELSPHIWYLTDKGIIDQMKIDQSSNLVRRLRRDISVSGETTGNDTENSPLPEAVDEMEDFPKITVDLESDLQKFRVKEGGHKYVIDALWTAPATAEFQIVLRKTVEIAVFCDSTLVQNFGSNLPSSDRISITRYVQILVNALEGIYHQEELGGYIIDLKLVHIGLLGPGEGPSTSDGDIGNYLRGFSTWQSQQNPGTDSNPQHWDHAVMLSGLNLHSGGNRGVIGLAWVGGMCNAQLSSTINEGGSFLSLYIVAHEMGHNLGMDHDGSNSFASCNAQNHIMSPTVGPGKTTWSSCSIQVVRQFLSRTTCLDDASASPSTAATRPPTSSPSSPTPRPSSIPTRPSPLPTQRPPSGPGEIDKIKANLPGQIFPPSKQCKLALGSSFEAVINSQNDICSYLFCTDGRSTRGTHPALIGSDCANNRICIAGSCKPESELRRLIVLFRDLFEAVGSTNETKKASAK